VLARGEFDPAAAVVACRVEEVIVREGLIWEMRIGGQTIRTTAEHPHYVPGRGWVACQELRVGDGVLTELGTTLPVESLRDTGSFERVYNFRVADTHTYFVGAPEWGFAVWVHNARYRNDPHNNKPSQQRRLYEQETPTLVTNPKHHQNSRSVQPNNVAHLFATSIVDPNTGVRYAKDANGLIHRFSAPSNGQTHWNGSLNGSSGFRLENIPMDIRRQLG
jgi:hypothetical protein